MPCCVKLLCYWCCKFWVLLLLLFGFVLDTCRVTRKKMTALSARVQAGQFQISYAGTSYLLSLLSFLLLTAQTLWFYLALLFFIISWQWSWWCYMWWLYARTACWLAQIRAHLLSYCRLCNVLRCFQHSFTLLLYSFCLLYCYCYYYNSRLYICVIVAYSLSPRKPAP